MNLQRIFENIFMIINLIILEFSQNFITFIFRTLDATNNYWGITNETEIATKIFGDVYFSPILQNSFAGKRYL